MLTKPDLDAHRLALAVHPDFPSSFSNYPDPAFHFNADLVPDPAFHFIADLVPDPAFRLYTDPDPLFLIKVMQICDHWSTDPEGLHFKHPPIYCGRPRLYFEPVKLLNFDLNADRSKDSKIHRQFCIFSKCFNIAGGA